jgi:hypothetical protein
LPWTSFVTSAPYSCRLRRTWAFGAWQVHTCVQCNILRGSSPLWMWP